MKKNTLIMAVGLSASSAAIATPFMNHGDGPDIFFVGADSVRYDDNVLQSENGKINDTIFEADPGLEFTSGKNAQLVSLLTYSEAITRYVDTSKLDTNLARVNLTSSYDNKKTQVNLGAGFNQLNQNTPTSGVPGLLRRDATNGNIKAETDLSPKTSVDLGFTYDKTEYKVAGLQDSKIYSVPVDVFYEYTPKLSLLAGFRYRRTDLQSLPDYQDYYYSVGARGEFSAKLSGQFGVGLNQRRATGGNESSVGLNSNFLYAFSPKTTVNFGLSNDFGAASAGQSQKTFTVNGGVETLFSVDWKGNAALTYSKTEYVGTPARTDNYYEGSLSATYIINQNINVTASYTYRNNSSDAIGQSFKDNVLALTAAFRY